MSKAFREIISILAATVLLFSCAMPAFAASTCSCGNYPVVVVNGMGDSPYIKDAGSRNEEVVFPPQSDDIKKIVALGVPALMASMASNNYSLAEKVIIPLAKDMLEGMSFNPDGTSKYNVTTANYGAGSVENYPDVLGGSNERGLAHTFADELGADHVYVFNYDWRYSPLDNCVELRRIVEMAKAETGHNKVSLTACSMGGIVTLAYLYKYGGADINSCTMLSSTFCGTNLVNDIFNKRITITEKDLNNFLNDAVAKDETEEKIFDYLFVFLDFLGTTDRVFSKADDAVATLIDDIYWDVIIPCFGYFPGLWALVNNDEDFENGKKLMLEKADDSFIEYIDFFHYNVMNNRKNILDDAQAQGMKLYIVSHYDKCGYPLYDAVAEQTDGLLETSCTSGGATCAPYGEALPDSYVQVCCTDLGHKHISPDKILDASTAMYPEQVWLIKDYRHVGCKYGTNMCQLVYKFTQSDEQLTVSSLTDYPQFLEMDENENIKSGVKFAYIKGNMDQTDDSVTTSDARLALRVAAQLETVNSMQKYLGDMDDNNVIDTTDARTILRIAAKLQ